MSAIHTRSAASLADKARTIAKRHPYALAAAATVGALAISALVNRHLAKNAENDNPPGGQFLEVNGVRLHYVERGAGTPLVLLHGNGSMIQDFESSGLIELAAQNYRVIVFDRPGFGYSDRPRNVVWTPAAQAELFAAALSHLGISHAIVLGHSWGSSVAVALAIKYPKLVQGLVLASGYYYPTVRLDVIPLSAPAVPAAESALMIPNASHYRNEYSSLKMPVVVIAGEKDRFIDIDAQSARLHSDISHSSLHRIPGTGHMIHQTAPRAVMAAINDVGKIIKSS
jgi:pimeloyl-ACP methyl ester carboxylesterase